MSQFILFHSKIRSLRTNSAIRLCKFHSSIAIASVNPPRNKTITSLKYNPHTFLPGRTPAKGQANKGIRAVAESGAHSKHQQTTIIATTQAHQYYFFVQNKNHIKIILRSINQESTEFNDLLVIITLDRGSNLCHINPQLKY